MSVISWRTWQPAPCTGHWTPHLTPSSSPISLKHQPLFLHIIIREEIKDIFIMTTLVKLHKTKTYFLRALKFLEWSWLCVLGDNMVKWLDCLISNSSGSMFDRYPFVPKRQWWSVDLQTTTNVKIIVKRKKIIYLGILLGLDNCSSEMKNE